MFREPARDLPLYGRYDVVVIGGGPSGVAAAFAAARGGARTLLVERYGFLGGMGSAAGVTSFCGLYAQLRGGEIEQIVHGFADDLLHALEGRDALAKPHTIFGRNAGRAYDNAAFKCVLDELVTNAGAELLFHARVAGAAIDEDRLRAVFVETVSGRLAIAADVFIDGSGDGVVATHASVPSDIGDEHGHVAFPTLMFRMGAVDTPRALAEGKPRLRELMAAAEAEGAYRFARKSAYINPQPHAGEWRANVNYIARPDGAPIDPLDTRELSDGERFGRREVETFLRFLKERVPGFADAYLLEIAPQLGIRESRRVHGVHRLTGAEVLGSADFEDGIGVSGWPIERHEGAEVLWQFIEGRGYHALPYRMLLPAAGPRNLLVVGRCASGTREAQSSFRVSGPCFVMGEAAGTAAAMARDLAANVHAVDPAALRAALARARVFLG